MVMKRNQGIQNLRERVVPISRTESFGRIFGTKHENIKDQLTHEIILQLIMQHLSTVGYKKTKKIIQKDSGVQYIPRYLRDSRLQSLVRVAIKNVDTIWDQTLDSQTTQTDFGIGIVNLLSALGYERGEEFDEELTSIWEEEQNTSIIYEEKSVKKENPKEKENEEEEKTENVTKEIKAASLNQLVEFLTHETKPKVLWLKTFLMTYQSFTTPRILLYKLIDRYNIPKEKQILYQNRVQQIKLRVCNFLKFWITDYFSDFNEKLLNEVQDFIENTLINDGFKGMAENLKQVIERNLNSCDSKDNSNFEDPPDAKLPKNIFSPKLSLFDVDPEEIARQITLIDFSLYKKIKAPEMMNLAWLKPQLKHRAQNLIALNKRINSIPMWTATMILKAPLLKNRTKMVSRMISIAFHLRKLNNFSSCFAIIKGLSLAPIKRLKFTYESISKKTLDTFNSLASELNELNTLNKYRDLLVKINPPCIQYLQLYLSALKKIENNHDDYFNSLINFKKRRLIYDVVNSFQRFQKAEYNFLSVYQIESRIKTFPSLEETILIQKSLKCEPRRAKREEIK
ncbi:ras guanine nucleotide exchange factor i-related [Anaeramoeba flamelloides]|uniref:Ras guanine nucleotide exchange factor i-related n=1 Tax=Anaeramoeba flamelloides TaxID=1746091 RepID=A0ABQ8YUE1_9EUKA|nr:ras guanine nucleotide exchange factor i-related [Anaeramoeba flamelloides]